MSTLAPAISAPAVPAAPARRAHSRLQLVLDEAARVFAQRGFVAASVRDIVQPIGMQPGSLYYHFPTKEDLLVAVYREGVQRLSDKVDAAVAAQKDPWRRLEAACIAHLETLLDRSAYSRVVIRVAPVDAPSVAGQLTALRDLYEQRFVELVAALPLRDQAQARDLRLLLLGGLNWSQTWFREGGEQTPAQIAAGFVRLLRSTQRGN